MDVAFVTNVVYPFVPGGAQKRVHELGTRLADRGHDVTVYGRRFWDGPRERHYEGLTLRGVAPERDLYVDDRRSIREAIGFATALWRPLRRHLDEHDVIDASVFPFFPVLSVRAAASLADVPVVTTWHECWRGYWREYLGRAGYGGMAIERVVARLPQYPVAVSNVTADRLAEIGPDRDRIRVIPNGIDRDAVAAVEPASPGFDVLFAGRLTGAKQVDRLLRAFATLATTIDGPTDGDVRLGIVGDGPARAELEALARELGIAERVTFVGFLEDHDEVLAQMRAADVFVSPSTREGFGITAVEAMAAGCTVVAVDHPQSAASEVIGDAGVLVPSTDDDLARGLRRALTNPDLPADPVERAGGFDWEPLTDRAAAAYRDASSGDW